MANEWIAPTYNELLKSIDVGNYADKLYMNYLTIDVVVDDWVKTNQIRVGGQKVKVDFKTPLMTLFHSQKTLMYLFEFRAVVNGKEVVARQEVSEKVFSTIADEIQLKGFLDAVRASFIHTLTDHFNKQMEYVFYSDHNVDLSQPKFVLSGKPKVAELSIDWTITGNQAGHAKLQPSVKKVLPNGDKSIYVVKVDCPAGCKVPMDVYHLIQHLNDTHTWDRKTQIADWLDTLHDAGIIDITITSPNPDKA